jgi:transcriptional regulator with XRE-family HTH domain
MRATTDYVLNRKAIQHYLIDHDLTQGDFSKTLGISASYFSELLNGRKSISLSILFSIAEETGVDIHELVIEVGE